MYEGAPNIDLVIVPAIDGNFDPATNELIPFERQFQFLHSLQNYFLTNELLAPGHVDADGRQRRLCARRGPASWPASASGRSTSSARPPPRSSWTRSTGSSERRGRRTMHTFAYARPATLAEAVALLDAHGPDARLLAGGTDLVIRLRDGDAPAGRRDRPQADRRAAARRSARTAAGSSISATTVMTDIAADDAGAPPLPGAGRGGGGRRARSRSATGPRWPATSATRRPPPTPPRRSSSTGPSWSPPGPAGRGGSRSTSSSSAPASRPCARASSSRRSSCPSPARRMGAVHVRRTRRRGHDLASVTLCCGVDEAGRHPARLRQRRAAAGPASSTRAACWRTRPRRTRRRRRSSSGCSPDASPSPRSMRAEPRVPPGDAARPRRAGAGDRDRAAGGGGVTR